MFKVLPLRYRIFLSFLVIPLFVVIINVTITIPNAKKERVEALKLRAYDQVLATKSIVRNIFSKYGYTEEAIEIAKEVIRAVRYGEDSVDYLFSGTTEMKMLVHPIRSELDGLDITQLKSADGKFIGRDVIKIGLAGGGYYDYSWAMPNGVDTGEKLAYIELIDEKLGWIVGASMYTYTIDRYVTSMYKFAFSIMIIIVLLSLVVGYFSVSYVKTTITTYADNMKKAILGDLSVRHDLKLFEKFIPLTARYQTDKIAEICFFSIGTLDGDHTCAALDEFKSCEKCSFYKKITQNEFGNLGAWFNKFLSEINTIFYSMKNSAEDTFNNAEELNSVSETIAGNAQENAAVFEEVTSTVEEISAGTANIAVFANEQRNSLQLLNKNLEEMHRIVSSAGASVMDAVKSKDLMTASLFNTQKVIKKTKESIDLLQTDIEQIKQISNIIGDIADQVNLLSLNASIEAARAGDHGKGFSVVATEIGKLAASTAFEAKSIQQLIKNAEKSMQGSHRYIVDAKQEVDVSLKEIDTFTAKINNVAVLAQEDMQLQEAIKLKSQTILSNAESISHATSEHELAIEDVSTSIMSVNNLAQTYAASAEELTGSSESLAQHAKTLLQLVSKYKV